MGAQGEVIYHYTECVTIYFKILQDKIQYNVCMCNLTLASG